MSDRKNESILQSILTTSTELNALYNFPYLAKEEIEKHAKAAKEIGDKILKESE